MLSWSMVLPENRKSTFPDHAQKSRPRQHARAAFHKTDKDAVREKPNLLQRLANGDGELADALDFALDLVAGDRGGDARRRAGHDDVTGGELHHLRKLGDDIRHVPDQLVEIAVLADLAV